MSDWSPPSVPRPWLAAAGLLYVLFLAYSILIRGRVLSGVWLGVVLASLYLLWRFLAAFEAIADAQQRLAQARERERE